MAARTIAWAYVLTSIAAVVQANSKIDCNDGKFYIRADPESCSHFYKCDNGKPVRFACGDGLYFNPTLYVCDWPYNVKCSINSKTKQEKPSKKTTSSSYNSQEEQYNGQNYNKGQRSNKKDSTSYNSQEEQNNGQNNNKKQRTSKKENSSINKKYNGQNNARENKNNGNDQLWNNGNEGTGETPHYMVLDVPEEGPSVQDPLGPLERPRPTVDDDKSANNHPYREYVPENDIDIR